MKTAKILFLLIVLITLTACTTFIEKKVRTMDKFNPGHYIGIGLYTGLDEIDYLDEPAIRGVNKRYLWKDLEPEKGVYDFSSIEDDLESLEKLDKQLIVFLMDKSCSQKSALPEYLSYYEVSSDWGGYSPVRWHPVYVERFVALGKAIAERFDSNPNFEGVAIQESSLGIPETGYTKFGYTDSNGICR